MSTAPDQFKGHIPDEPEETLAFESRSVRLGARLKALRKRKLLTITQLALYTGLSVGYLSNVERGQSSPTVDNLARICKALGVTMNEVLSEESVRRDYIRCSEARFYERPESAMGIRLYDFGDGYDGFQVITIDAGCEHIDPEAMHPYPEMVYVTKGKLTLTIDDEVVVLGPGDAYCIRAGHRHTIENRGRSVCESLYVRLSDTGVTRLM